MSAFNLIAEFQAKQSLMPGVDESSTNFQPASATRRGAAKSAVDTSPRPIAGNYSPPAASGLTKYIPTEVLTIFVGTVSAQDGLIALQNQWGTNFQMIHLYLAFVFFSGAFFLLAYLTTLKTGRKPIPPAKSWPWFRATASSIAFAIWALSVPGTGLLPNGTASVAGVLALGISFVLSKVEVFFEPSP